MSPAGRQAVETALRQIDRLTAELEPLRRQLDMLSRRQPGCRALRAHFGIGAVTSVAIWAELGDVRRFGSSDDVVRSRGARNIRSGGRARAVRMLGYARTVRVRLPRTAEKGPAERVGLVRVRS